MNIESLRQDILEEFVSGKKVLVVGRTMMLNISGR